MWTQKFPALKDSLECLLKPFPYLNFPKLKEPEERDRLLSVVSEALVERNTERERGRFSGLSIAFWRSVSVSRSTACLRLLTVLNSILIRDFLAFAVFLGNNTDDSWIVARELRVFLCLQKSGDTNAVV